MASVTIQETNGLIIYLNKDTYFPGQLMSGVVYRCEPIDTRSAVLMVCIHGQSRVMLQPFGSSEKSYSCFALVRTCQDNPGILRRGPLRIKKGKERSWSFSFIVPVFADPRENEQISSPSYTPVGASDHQLPPSYTLHKYDVVTACVEYHVCAKLIYLDAEERTQVAHAIHPFKLIHYSPHPPITYSAAS